ncbi:hypothetical protein TH44_02000 [Thalassospira xiamenensis]|uniref:Uncharacterized protein n=1 Tax=Thalassospira xiamenensis TaxID=220697 RepID=A0A367XH80_9PROT|nr:hypothetical protein AUP41_06005 [Thalassospira xiamenensis]RCK53006.1 hypothetical protein TH44_02000 [Thalassospira xiamenensis]
MVAGFLFFECTNCGSDNRNGTGQFNRSRFETPVIPPAGRRTLLMFPILPERSFQNYAGKYSEFNALSPA